MSFPATHRLRLVQVHAIEGAFPFYGKFETDPPGRRERLAGPDPSPSLSPRLAHGVDRRAVKLGDDPFHGGGSAEEEPGESPAVSMMAPRAYVPLSTLAATGLAGNEALARYRGDGPVARRPRSRRGWCAP